MRYLAQRAGRFLKKQWALPSVDPRAREKELTHWYSTPLGEHFLASEAALAERMLGSGYRPFLVQLDSGAHRMVGLNARLRSQLAVIMVRGESRAACPVVAADPEQLPLQPETVDVMLLHHVLEYSPVPHRVLREAAQALKPGGHLLLFGFNPFGLWGLRRLVTPWRRRFAPWEGPFIRAGRVADWGRLLDCEVESRRYYYHWPALHRPGWKRRARWINHLIRMVWPGMGAGYVLLLRKQQMIPLKPARWQPSLFLGRRGTGAHLRVGESAVRRPEPSRSGPAESSSKGKNRYHD